MEQRNGIATKRPKIAAGRRSCRGFVAIKGLRPSQNTSASSSPNFGQHVLLFFNSCGCPGNRYSRKTGRPGRSSDVRRPELVRGPKGQTAVDFNGNVKASKPLPAELPKDFSPMQIDGDFKVNVLGGSEDLKLNGKVFPEGSEAGKKPQEAKDGYIAMDGDLKFKIPGAKNPVDVDIDGQLAVSGPIPASDFAELIKSGKIPVSGNVEVELPGDKDETQVDINGDLIVRMGLLRLLGPVSSRVERISAECLRIVLDNTRLVLN
ncbi:hypothetical protein L596_014206 [Steinernema carpocapsae]|uniref:Uncharacterized protein n=1 Tax=Steinernema carpocapsae TaxID=34508 RepID=A0A4U5NB66_STECR|nr:hypothetical protein L596_014206 [Steinernema carpocapsae]